MYSELMWDPVGTSFGTNEGSKKKAFREAEFFLRLICRRPNLLHEPVRPAPPQNATRDPSHPPRKIGSTTFPGLSQTGEGWCFQFLGCPSVPNPPAGKSKLDSPRSESDRGGSLLGFDVLPSLTVVIRAGFFFPTPLEAKPSCC